MLHFPGTEPLYLLLDGVHKPYQVSVPAKACHLISVTFVDINICIIALVLHTQAQVRNQQAQETFVGITRGPRTLKGRVPATADGEDPVAAWKCATTTMKESMQQGTFVPFRTALEKALITDGSSLKQFTIEASKLLSRRRLYRVDGAAVRDADTLMLSCATQTKLCRNLSTSKCSFGGEFISCARDGFVAAEYLSPSFAK